MKKNARAVPPVPKSPILPKETIEIAERRELLFSGVLGIEDYHTEKIRIRTVRGIIEVCGCALSLAWAGEKRLLLRGYPKCLNFEHCPEKKGGCRPCR